VHVQHGVAAAALFLVASTFTHIYFVSSIDEEARQKINNEERENVRHVSCVSAAPRKHPRVICFLLLEIFFHIFINLF
jgi:hypothetical protein